MSIAELKATADKLSPKERRWLKSYLAAKEMAADPAWRTEMSRRLKRMREGHGITDVEYYRRTRRTSRKTPAAAK